MLEEVDDLVFSSALSRENRKQLNTDENFYRVVIAGLRTRWLHRYPIARDVLHLDRQRARKRVEYAIRVR